MPWTRVKDSKLDDHKYWYEADGLIRQNMGIFTHIGREEFRKETNPVTFWKEDKNGNLKMMRRSASIRRGTFEVPVPYLPKKESKSFNVRGRAINTPKKDTWVFTANQKVLELSQKHGIETIELWPQMPNQIDEFCLQKSGEGFVARILERDCFYFQKISHDMPLEERETKQTKAKKKGKKRTRDRVKRKNFKFDISWDITGPLHKASRGKGQNSTMGGSAWQAVEELKKTQKAEGMWEWLHLLGSALGGPNGIVNLGAGTYDANTWMIPLESEIISASKQCSLQNKGWVRVRGEFYPETDVLIWLELSAEVGTWRRSQYVRASRESVAMDKFMYDYFAGLHAFEEDSEWDFVEVPTINMGPLKGEAYPEKLPAEPADVSPNTHWSYSDTKNPLSNKRQKRSHDNSGEEITFARPRRSSIDAMEVTSTTATTSIPAAGYLPPLRRRGSVSSLADMDVSVPAAVAVSQTGTIQVFLLVGNDYEKTFKPYTGWAI